MTRPRIATPLLLAMVALPYSFPLHAQEAPEVVLSDSPAFCVHLQETLSAIAAERQAPLPPDVERLSDEGVRLCAEGSTRAGILRLRRAMVLISRDDPALPPAQAMPAAGAPPPANK
jgi:hypothetical protein